MIEEFEIIFTIINTHPRSERDICIKANNLKDANEIAKSLKKYNKADMVLIEIIKINKGE